MFGSKKKCRSCATEETDSNRIERIDGHDYCRGCGYEYIYNKYDLSSDKKKSILMNLISSMGRFSRPFEKEGAVSINHIGDDWHVHSQLILNVLIADTLFSIENKLSLMNERLNKVEGGSKD